VQPDADRAAELFLMPNCFPAPGQTLCPCNGLRVRRLRQSILWDGSVRHRSAGLPDRRARLRGYLHERKRRALSCCD
jgi:hypothetical protein